MIRLIVALVGLASVLAATLEIPRYWTPVLVGTALFLIGALRRITADPHRPPDGGDR
jgi:hypothetical protein